jgi:hypothetical protein
MTLTQHVLCRYEAHTVRPGSIKLFVSGQVTPHEMFLPLLGAAAAAGVNPNLGKAKDARLDVQQLVQVGCLIKPCLFGSACSE